MNSDSGNETADCAWQKYLTQREIDVCESVCSSGVEVGFNEIRRKTGLHQEKLSRVLKRLMFRELIVRNGTKYSRCCHSGQY